MGLGYAYEATKEVLAVVHALPQYATILATTVPHNVKSIGLLKKLGFQYVQELDVETVKLHIYACHALA
jgi:RimJ/RimL family protein N-acetyltransferase